MKKSLIDWISILELKCLVEHEQNNLNNKEKTLPVPHLKTKKPPPELEAAFLKFRWVMPNIDYPRPGCSTG